MSCLSQLISNQFLKNTHKELQLARTALSTLAMPEPGLLPCTKSDKKALYQYYEELLGFKDSYGDMHSEDYDMLYCIQDSHIVWIATRNKKLYHEALLDSVYTNGDVPFYQARQFINNRLYHVAMYDLTFTIQPLTKN